MFVQIVVIYLFYKNHDTSGQMDISHFNVISTLEIIISELIESSSEQRTEHF